MTMTNDVLYNCCTNAEEPDWSQFDALELGGCITHTEDDGESWTEGGVVASEAQFFTVYGHLKEGGCEAITDVMTYDECFKVGQWLAERSGLKLTVYC